MNTEYDTQKKTEYLSKWVKKKKKEKVSIKSEYYIILFLSNVASSAFRDPRMKFFKFFLFCSSVFGF